MRMIFITDFSEQFAYRLRGILQYADDITDMLWVSDSEAFKLFVFDGAVTKLLATYDVSFIGNPEAVLVDHARSCVWVGDDRGSSSRIYKISFYGL